MIEESLNRSHAIMFHHFHDEKHLPSQGSLNSEDFSEMLTWLANRYNLIGAGEYLEKFESEKLDNKDICLSFDDALLCQYEIAVPILARHNLEAFFFVYSSAFRGNSDNLELYRYFRTSCFSDIEEFYSAFFSVVNKQFDEVLAQHHKLFEIQNYLGNFQFYSKNDRWFRYLRDQVLGPTIYDEIMSEMIREKEFSHQNFSREIWMSEDHLRDLVRRGHIVGLHSYSHPTQISKLTFDEQYREYSENFEHLRSIVGDVVSMSHPCGDYNDDTLKILETLGLKIGFRSSFGEEKTCSKYEVPREDHSHVFEKMKNGD